MADLTFTEASQPINIVGADETNVAKVSDQGELFVSNFANVTLVDATKTITTTESLAAVGGSNLANRKSLVIYNRGAQDVFYGTTGVDDTTGIPIIKDEIITLAIGENVSVYLVTKTGTASVTFQEFA